MEVSNAHKLELKGAKRRNQRFLEPNQQHRISGNLRKDAIRAVPYLALDLVDRSLAILDVGHEGGRDPTRVGEDGGGVVEGAHEGDGGEGGGVHEARRGGEAEPAVDEHEDGGEVEEADREDDDGDGEGEPDPASPLHLAPPLSPGGTTGGEMAATPETTARAFPRGEKE